MSIVSVSRAEFVDLAKGNERLVRFFEILQNQSQATSISDATLNSLYAEIQALKVKNLELQNQINILNSFNINSRLTALENAN